MHADPVRMRAGMTDQQFMAEVLKVLLQIGVGVKPDVKVPKSDALTTAQDLLRDATPRSQRSKRSGYRC